MSESRPIDPNTTPPARPFLQQFGRAYRFLDRYDRYRVADHLDNDGATFNDLEDSLWAFFQNCWHIRDWIRNDPTLSDEVKEEIWEAVQNSRHILVAADLANGSKHFGQDPKRQWTQARDAAIPFHDEQDGKFRVEHLIDLGDGTTMRAIDVANRAMDEWFSILESLKLIARP